MDWISVDERIPSGFCAALLWIVGGPLHNGEDYADVGIWNPRRQQWQEGYYQRDGSCVDLDVLVSHWAEIEPPAPTTAKEDNDEAT